MLDNARTILITLVVVGHAIEDIDTALANILYTWIYSFHMPAFVVISGFLSRSYRNEPRQISGLLTSLIVPYLIFQTLHSIEQDLLNGTPVTVNLWDPAWTLWFPLALCFWRLLTPLLRTLRYPLVFVVAISVIAPLDASLDATLSWARILSFLPFFVLGLVCTRETIAKIRGLRGRQVIGGAILVGALICAAFTHEMFSTSIFTMSLSYEERDMAPLYGVTTRVLALLCGAILTVALLMITPHGKRWYTYIGTQSLTVYLVHSMVLEVPRQCEWFDAIEGFVPTAVVVLAAIVLVLLLSRRPVVKALSWLTSPPIGQFLIRAPEASSADQTATPR